MLAQIVMELPTPGVEISPRLTRVFRRREVMRPMAQRLKPIAVFIVLMAHAPDGKRRARAASCKQQREQDLLLLVHMGVKLAQHLGEEVSEARGAVRMGAMHGFHLTGKAVQSAQLATVNGRG